jgi:hypothetical protein
MTKFSFIVFVLVLFICFGQVAAQNRSATPRFSDYPVTNIFTGNNAPVKLVSSADRTYRTRLREAAREDADFAGHHKIALIGCGTNCMLAAVINLRTGRVYWFPETINQALSDEVDAIIGEDPVKYSVDSKLLAFPTLKDHDSDKYVYLQYYVFEGSRFTLIKSVKKRRSGI